MDLEDVFKIMFVILWGIFVYCVMLFGLSIISVIFQRVMTEVLYEVIGKFLRVFFDDFAVYG